MAITINGTTGITYPDASLQATGNGLAKAWVNFNGTGTVAIRASFNVSSITDNAVGLYTLNFATAMVDTNYAVVGNSVFDTTSGRSPRTIAALSYTTTTCQVNSVSTASSEDNPYNHVAIFR